jgi:hypothetical protein
MKIDYFILLTDHEDGKVSPKKYQHQHKLFVKSSHMLV